MQTDHPCSSPAVVGPFVHTVSRRILAVRSDWPAPTHRLAIDLTGPPPAVCPPPAARRSLACVRYAVRLCHLVAHILSGGPLFSSQPPLSPPHPRPLLAQHHPLEKAFILLALTGGRHRCFHLTTTTRPASSEHSRVLHALDPRRLHLAAKGETAQRAACRRPRRPSLRSLATTRIRIHTTITPRIRTSLTLPTRQSSTGPTIAARSPLPRPVRFCRPRHPRPRHD